MSENLRNVLSMLKHYSEEKSVAGIQAPNATKFTERQLVEKYRTIVYHLNRYISYLVFGVWGRGRLNDRPNPTREQRAAEAQKVFSKIDELLDTISSENTENPLHLLFIEWSKFRVEVQSHRDKKNTDATHVSFWSQELPHLKDVIKQVSATEEITYGLRVSLNNLRNFKQAGSTEVKVDKLTEDELFRGAQSEQVKNEEFIIPSRLASKLNAIVEQIDTKLKVTKKNFNETLTEITLLEKAWTGGRGNSSVKEKFDKGARDYKRKLTLTPDFETTTNEYIYSRKLNDSELKLPTDELVKRILLLRVYNDQELARKRNLELKQPRWREKEDLQRYDLLRKLTGV